MVVLLLGIAAVGGSIWVSDPFWSSFLGVLAFSSFWTIGEIKEQRQRVLRGWFPMDPAAAPDYLPDHPDPKSPKKSKITYTPQHNAPTKIHLPQQNTKTGDRNPSSTDAPTRIA